ncbi:hypothetical protein B0H10DRAFT_1971279 [Mycena sp. CBHHK59/15]|nr:hypothetical protein B0H10DRAFT_1971279 [Mycena sp. CBHHK59/15]
MSQLTSNSNSGANSGLPSNSERWCNISLAVSSFENCVKSGAECQLCAGKSVACTRCQTCKEKCEFAELRYTGRIPFTTPVPAASLTPVSPPSLGRQRRGMFGSRGMDAGALWTVVLLQARAAQAGVQATPVLLPCCLAGPATVVRDVYSMEHAVGRLTNWAMSEDVHFTAGPTPRLRRLSPTPGPPMTDFAIDDELHEQSLNPTINNIFFNFNVPEEQMEVKQKDDLGVGTSRVRSNEAQEEMEVEDGLVIPADEDSEFDGEEWEEFPRRSVEKKSSNL